MAAERTVKHGDLTFNFWSKSIQVCTPVGCQMLYLGRKPNDKDIVIICRLLNFGAAIKTANIRKVLSAPLFDEN